MAQTNPSVVSTVIAPSQAETSDLLDAVKKLELNLKEQVADGLSALKDAKVDLTMHVTDKLVELDKTQSDLKDTGRTFAEQLDKNVKKQDELLAQLNFYKWVIHIVFVGVLGGSIVALMQFQPYIDKRIAGRVSEVEKKLRSEQSTALSGLRGEESKMESDLTEKIAQLERINQAFAYASTLDFFDAYALICQIYKDIKGNKVDISTDQKEVFYADVLWILSQLEVVDEDGDWQGQNLWNELANDEFFHGTDFLESEWLEAEAQTQYYLALCHEKYDHTEGIEPAKGYYEKARKATHLKVNEAPELFGLAMLALINRDQNKALVEALEKLKAANEIDPINYNIVYLADNELAYKNGGELSYEISGSKYQIFKLAAKRRGVPFEYNFEALMTQIRANRDQIERWQRSIELVEQQGHPMR